MYVAAGYDFVVVDGVVQESPRGGNADLPCLFRICFVFRVSLR